MLFFAFLAAPAFALDFGGSSDSDSPSTATAAVVLGFTPEDIALPGTPVAAAASLGTAFGDGTAPDSFALELTPYWLGTGAGRQLDLREYVQGGLPSLGRNLAVSLAIDSASSVIGLESTDDMRAAVGLRTSLWAKPAKGTAPGEFAASWDQLFGQTASADGSASEANATPKEPDACAASIQHLSDFSAWLNAALTAKLAESNSDAERRAGEKQQAAASLCSSTDAGIYPKTAKACVEAGFAPAAATPDAKAADDDKERLARVEQITGELDQAYASIETDVSAAVKTLLKAAKDDPSKLDGDLATYLDDVGFADAFGECAELMDRRQGFVLDLAGGVGVAAPDQVLEDTAMSDWALWAAPGWVAKNWSVAGLARLRAGELVETPAMVLDVGLGGGVRLSAATLSVQGLYGVPINNATPTGKVLVGADVRVSKGVWFYTAIGASFPADEPESLFSYLSIKFASDTEATLKTPGPTEMASLISP